MTEDYRTIKGAHFIVAPLYQGRGRSRVMIGYAVFHVFEHGHQKLRQLRQFPFDEWGGQDSALALARMVLAQYQSGHLSPRTHAKVSKDPNFIPRRYEKAKSLRLMEEDIAFGFSDDDDNNSDQSPKDETA